MRIAILVVLFSAIVTMPVASEAASVTAEMSSDYSVSIIKMTARNSPNPEFDSVCLEELSGSALSGEYESFLTQNFDTQERAQLDEFYGSTAGRKFMSDALRQTESRKFGVRHEPVQFSSEERDLVETFVGSPLWTKYKEVALQFGPEWNDQVGVAFAKLFLSCKRT